MNFGRRRRGYEIEESRIGRENEITGTPKKGLKNKTHIF